ncbi:MAG: T9SS type A sorting domain-containing protein [Bacteroidota bacterium]
MQTSKANCFLANKIKKLSITLCTFIVLSLLTINAEAQLFVRTTFNSTYTAITTAGGATVSTATGNDANQSGIPLGFTFNYAGVNYTEIGLNTNGLLWFDSIAPGYYDGNSNDRLHRAIGTNQSIAVWWNHLSDDTLSDVLYQLQGTPGSRTFTVQYTNFPYYIGETDIRLNDQVIFYEGTNVIEFRYGTLNVTAGAVITLGATIGIEYGAGGANNYIDAVTGSKTLGNGLLSPLVSWPKYNFRFTPGTPTPIAGGIYNVGIGQTYPSLTQAVADLNHRGISGPVTLNLTDAQYDTSVANGSNIFPILVGPISGISAVNTLTISKTGAPATLAYRGSPVVQSTIANLNSFSALQSNEEPILGVCASYTTISNINLISHGTLPHLVEVGLLVFGDSLGTQHSVFDKITVDLDRSNVYSIGINTVNTSYDAALAGTNSYNIYRDITVRDCNGGVYLGGVGTATQPHDVGNQIISSSCGMYNSIGDPSVPNDIGGGTFASYGIWLQAQENFTLKNTIIRNVSTTNYLNSVDGLIVASGKGICEISNNIIQTISRNNVVANSLSILTGMRISHYATATTIRIFNNRISDLLTSYTGASFTGLLAKGISFEAGGSLTTTYELWNNSISIDGSSYPNASTTCLEIQQGTLDTYIMKNNVFANFTSAQTAPAGHYCITTTQANQIGSITTSSDYNDLYIANDQGTSGHVGRGATTNYSTLGNWQTGISFHTGIDANSISVNPLFVNNNNDLNLTASSPLIGLGTTPPAYILTSDIFCQPLTAPYPMGFDGRFTTGINEIAQQPFYFSDVAPNPFTSQINFSVLMLQPGKLKITLTNTIGQQVKMIYNGTTDAGKQNFTITDLTLKSGIYFLKAEGDFGVDVKRIVCV